MLYDLINVRKDGQDINYMHLVNTEVQLNTRPCIGKVMKIDTVGGVLKTAEIVSIKRNAKHSILRVETEDGYQFYFKNQIVETKPFYIVKGGVA